MRISQGGIPEVQITDGTDRSLLTAPGDTQTLADEMLQTLSIPEIYNGSTFDRLRNTYEETILASADRTATTTSAVFTNYNARGLLVNVHVTANPGSQTLAPRVDGILSPASGEMSVLGSPPNITGNGLAVYPIYPGITDSAAAYNDYQSGVAPRRFTVRIVHSASGTWTYSVGVVYLV